MARFTNVEILFLFFLLNCLFCWTLKAEEIETKTCSKGGKEELFVERETNKYKAKANTENLDKPDLELKTITTDSGRAPDTSLQSEQLVTDRSENVSLGPSIKNTDDGFIQAENEKKTEDKDYNATVRDKVYDETNFSENKKDMNQWLGLQIPIIHGVKVGHVQDVEVLPGVKRQMKTLSMRPAVFEIPNFLDDVECDVIIAMAERKIMRDNPKTTYNGGLYFDDPESTFNAWDYNRDGFLDPEEIVLLPGKIDLRFSEKDTLKMFSDLKIDKDNNGLIDLEEFKNTDLSELNNYFMKMMDDGSKMRNATSKMAWLWHDEDELLRYQPEVLDRFHHRVQQITRLPQEILEESEPLQIRRFDEGTYHYYQHDSEPFFDKVPCCLYGESRECRVCRFITIAYFLSDVKEGGELVFPLADSNYEEDLMKNSGNWSGYFTYAKTTGSKNKFDVQLTFKFEGANKVFVGKGSDDDGEFELLNSIVTDTVVKFKKRYKNEKMKDTSIKYVGRVSGGSAIHGKWWVVGKARRMHGEFYMYYSEYERWAKRQEERCNTREYCPTTNLVIKSQKGKALLWYNHETTVDGRWIGGLDRRAHYGHCEVKKGEKWLATSWININGDGISSLKAWRRGQNWLLHDKRDTYSHIMTSMRSDTNSIKPNEVEECYKKDVEEEQSVLSGGSSSKPAERHVLNAVTSLLRTIDDDGMRAVSKVVHEKLQMMCIPLVVKHNGQISIVDGSKE